MRSLIVSIALLLASTTAHAYGSLGCDQYSKILLHFNGADASTSFTDEDCDGNGKKTITAVSTAQLDTAQSVFGGSSVLLNGTSDYFSAPDSDDWNFGSGDFTIDTWVRFNSTVGGQTIVCQWDATTASPQKAWIAQVGGGNITFFWTNDGSTNESRTFAWSPSANIWYHFAIVRSGNNLYAFIDGVQTGATADVTGETLPNVTTTLLPQRTTTGAVTAYFNGWIDEMRISKGIARWTSNFPVPSTQYCQGCEMKELFD